MRATAEQSKYAPFLVKGTATITGQAFLTTVGGDVKKGAGRTVTLDPATPYAFEWWARTGSVPLGGMPEAPLFLATRRTTVADADGRFRFAELPAGTYLLHTVIQWETGRYQYIPDTQSGLLTGTVTITDGQMKEIILNKM